MGPQKSSIKYWHLTSRREVGGHIFTILCHPCKMCVKKNILNWVNAGKNLWNQSMVQDLKREALARPGEPVWPQVVVGLVKEVGIHAVRTRTRVWIRVRRDVEVGCVLWADVSGQVAQLAVKAIQAVALPGVRTGALWG